MENESMRNGGMRKWGGAGVGVGEKRSSDSGNEGKRVSENARIGELGECENGGMGRERKR